MALTIYDIYNSLGLTAENGTQTLINSIRNSTELSGMTQLWDGSVTGLQEFGVAVNHSRITQNAFLNELIDRIGLVVLEQVSLNNPLGIFKKGRMEFGRTVQEIFTDIIRAESFNPEDAETTLFKRTMPNTKVLFHDNWRKELYPTTIEHQELEHAFISRERFESFIVTIYNALYNSNEVDEYIWTKSLIESYVNNGFATYIACAPVVDQASAQEFVKQARATWRKATLPQGSRSYNASGVMTRTREDQVYMIIDADLEASIDVDVLAYAFNMSRAELKSRTLVIENFATTGLMAVLCDERIFKIYDKEFTLRTVENGRGLYWNVFLHVHQLFSMSKFCNFIAFMSAGIPAVQRLTLTPMAVYMQAGTTRNFHGLILSTDNTTTVTATLTDSSGVAVAASSTATLTFLSGDSASGTYQVAVDLDPTLAPGDYNLTVTATNSTGTAFTTSQTALIAVLPQTEARTNNPLIP